MCLDISVEECAEMASTLSLIISRCIDDNNVQVYQSALIVLDEMLVQCEHHDLAQAKVTLMLSKIIPNIMTKLADSSKKVVDSAELSLLAMAHSSCVGIVYISNAATKKVQTADSKGGRTIKARLQFIENLVAEFGRDVPFKRVLDFAKGEEKLLSFRDEHSITLIPQCTFVHQLPKHLITRTLV
jgi:hypothetical protein